MKKNKDVEIITSALNEEGNIPELINRLVSIFDSENEYNWKLTIFDNGSSDNTWSKIIDGAARDSRIFGYQMTRTFSFDHALAAGIEMSKADALILMTSDLQDPPETIPLFLRKWESGSLHVAARINKRLDINLFKKMLTNLFYRFSNWATNDLIEQNISDFRLLDRKVYEAVLQLKEKYRFTRGLISWTGFKTEVVEIDRPKRFSGSTKTKYGPLVYFGVRSILVNSTKPLNFVSLVGVFTSIISLASVFIFSYMWLIRGVPFAGFGTILGFMLLAFSTLIFILGIMGQYLGLIYEEVQNRPLYLIKNRTELLN